MRRKREGARAHCGRERGGNRAAARCVPFHHFLAPSGPLDAAPLILAPSLAIEQRSPAVYFFLFSSHASWHPSLQKTIQTKTKILNNAPPPFFHPPPFARRLAWGEREREMAGGKARAPTTTERERQRKKWRTHTPPRHPSPACPSTNHPSRYGTRRSKNKITRPGERERDTPFFKIIALRYKKRGGEGEGGAYKSKRGRVLFRALVFFSSSLPPFSRPPHCVPPKKKNRPPPFHGARFSLSPRRHRLGRRSRPQHAHHPRREHD